MLAPGSLVMSLLALPLIFVSLALTNSSSIPRLRTAAQCCLQAQAISRERMGRLRHQENRRQRLDSMGEAAFPHHQLGERHGSLRPEATLQPSCMRESPIRTPPRKRRTGLRRPGRGCPRQQHSAQPLSAHLRRIRSHHALQSLVPTQRQHPDRQRPASGFRARRCRDYRDEGHRSRR
jgi:hypothetical protein